MYICYIDESGTPDVPGNTSHYILAGLSIPVEKWKDCDKDIETVKAKYDLANKEIHIAWVLRSYQEQNKIDGFESLNYSQRVESVAAFRTAELLRLQRIKNVKLYHQTKITYRKTQPYIHLTYKERRALVMEMAKVLSGWSFARLFAECVDKVHFNPIRTAKTIDEQSFEQVISRFEQYLELVNRNVLVRKRYGILIHDNNDTVAKKHTMMMKKYHADGTLWTTLNNIIETPLFVNSELTGMVQIADLCAYALRRYLENKEDDLFDLVFKRADRIRATVVGVRHYTNKQCTCKICSAHRKQPPQGDAGK